MRREPNDAELRDLTALAEQADKLIAAAGPAEHVSDLMEARARKTQERLDEIMVMRLGGMSYRQIAQRTGVTHQMVNDLISHAMKQVPKAAVDEMRALENQRLDEAQAAIWSRVGMGDEKAIEVFLKISTRRAKLNGLDEPTKIDLSIGIRQEMEAALAELQQVVLGEVIPNDDRTG